MIHTGYELKYTGCITFSVVQPVCIFKYTVFAGINDVRDPAHQKTFG